MDDWEIEEANRLWEDRLGEMRRKRPMTEGEKSERRPSSTEGQERMFSRFWDPEDPTTWAYFIMHYRSLYGVIPICRPLKSGKEIYPYPIPIFELYRMEMKKLCPPRSKDFNMVILHSDYTNYVPLVIYKRPPLPLPLEEEEEEEKEEDIIGRPLPLKGPGGLPSAEKPVSIIINNPEEGSGWYFSVNPFHQCLEYDKPLYEMCEDDDSGSKVVVFYEIIQKAVLATLVFRFMKYPAPQQGEGQGQGQGRQTIHILSGTIYAADSRNPGATKRIVKHFQKSPKQSALAYTNYILEVDRHVFGVPCGSRFEVTADLECTTLVEGRRGRGGAGEQWSPFTISGTKGFDVPTQTGSYNQFFTTTGSTSLRLTVSWGYCFGVKCKIYMGSERNVLRNVLIYGPGLIVQPMPLCNYWML